MLFVSVEYHLIYLRISSKCIEVMLIAVNTHITEIRHSFNTKIGLLLN